MKVLILDDYAKPREDARKALEDILDNVEVTEFSDPREALESYRRENYDLVISDILMPDMNGFEFAAAALRHKVTPIVMHTGSWSKDYITQFVLNGASDKVPLKVVGKKYVHDNCEEYKAALKEGIEGAVEKSKKLNSGFLRTMAGLVGYNIGLKLEGLDKINAKLAEKDDYLVDYIKAVYSELINNANEAANRLDNEKLKQRILEIEWTDPGKARNTLEYMHHFRGYPLPGLSMIMNMFPEESEAFSDLESIHEKMQDITSIIMDYREMGIAIPHEKRRYKKRLANQDREPIPMADFPVKLLGRQKFHQFLWDDQWKQNLHIISPGNNPEQHEKAIEEMLDIYDSLILRSMYRGEDGSLPLAGFFDSIVIKNIENYFYAVEQIRKMDSKALAELCLHRGLQEPDAKNMFIAAEVYHETSFLGAVIEHPNLEGLYLIEFGIRSLTKSNNWRSAQSILYDANNDVVIKNGLLPGVPFDPIELSKSVVDSSRKYLEIVGSNQNVASQVEFGFDFDSRSIVRDEVAKDGVNTSISPDSYHVNVFQSRDFKQRSPVKDYKIKEPQDASLVIGTSEGIDCVVIDTIDPIEYGVIAEKVRAHGYGIAYVSRPREDEGETPTKYQDINVASFVPDIDVLITGKGLKVMAHAYFNAMVNAKNTVLLEPGQLDKFGFESGDIVNYSSNGVRCSFKKKDGSEQVMYKIRAALNK